ncbi:MAG: hypothetical protein WD904_00985 [Dehalococcoidia bacterium]
MAARWEAQPTINPWTAVLVILETGVVCLVAVFGLMGALTTIAGGGAVIWGIANLVAASLVVVGALQAESAPRRGTALLAIGVMAMAGLWYWVWMVSVPFAALLIVLAAARAVNLPAKGVKS